MTSEAGPRTCSMRQSTQNKRCVYSSGSESDGEDAQTFSRSAQTSKKRKTTHDSDAEATASPAKRKGKSRWRNLGRLRALLDMPLDIVGEITSYLLPLDMLHLSRVSEHFRELFSPYKNKQAWVSARQNIPALPDCPADLNEGQYASLMFEHHCQECDASRGNIEDYALYIRLCKRCHNERVKKGTVVLRNIGEKKAPSEIWLLFPRSCPYRKYSGLRSEALQNDKYLVDDFESLATKYLRLLRAPTTKSDADLAKRRDLVNARHAFAKDAAEWRRVVVVDNENVERKRADE
ncbi:hypothetical protein BDV98DRAFT_537224 [Pterulicium gracile]|uniref:F-box domain-containing protein n=1 Tax=Pterulicium gracile TaxID=1884261 RepID=A0A5C3Q667_9AGAR|nr:hypothetical protein BDV98DRAFT_537224 [Pterula gracilis]